MIDWTKYDTNKAETTLAVANSPMFLLDGLRNNPEVIRLANKESTASIQAAFRAALQQPDPDLPERARPFILIAASAVKADPALRRQMYDLAMPYGGWIALLAHTVLSRPLLPAFTSLALRPALANSGPSKSAPASNTVVVLTS
jgi:hypothetical protein